MIGVDYIEALVNDAYSLGAVTEVEELHGGLTNRSFSVRTRSHGAAGRYLVRVYSEATSEDEIRFEHALLLHLAEYGFDLAASVHVDREGRSIQVLDDSEGSKRHYVSVFDFCRGDAKYTWMENRCAESELRSAARALAELHHACIGFSTEGLVCAKQPIIEYLAGLDAVLSGYAASFDTGAFACYFRSELPLIRSVLARGLQVLPRLVGMPALPVHCDFHPGNMTFLEGEMCGLFDFDWAKVDYRVYDIAIAMVYFFSCCQGDDKGSLRMKDAACFVDAYQKCAAKSPAPGPMSVRELEVLPRMMASANLFLLVWDLDCYFVEHRDETEYLGYLKNYVSIMEYIEHHEPLMRAIMLDLAPMADELSSVPGTN